MAHDSFRRFFHSVFTRLLLTCLLAGVAIIVLVVGFFSHLFKESAQANLQKHVLQYVNYVVKDLGSPPSYRRAREISSDSGIQIRYQGEREGWTTSEKVPSLADLDRDKKSGCFPLCRVYRHPYPIVVRRGTDAFIVTFRPEHTMVNGWELQTLVLIALLTAVVLSVYLVIRHALRPLKLLSEGVRQISEGHLDYEVPTGRCSEFGELAEAFNTMTGRVRTMLHAKEQLLLDVSHELRSPLTRMKVALAMSTDEQAKKGLNEDIREMETMVSEILEEARLRHAAGDLRIEPVAVGELFEEMRALYQGEPPGFEAGPAPEGAAIRADLSLVRIVLKNVISNALKYSPPEGEPVRLSYEEKEGRGVIRVRDRGVGIPDEDLPHIFEPFYRVDKSRSKRTGGYGLGLSLCKTIMDAHGERIEAASTPGAGTTISLFFTL